MGLIKAAVGALTGTLGDTWKEAIHCPVIGNNSIVADNRAVNGLLSATILLLLTARRCTTVMQEAVTQREQTTLSATARQSWLKKTPVC